MGVPLYRIVDGDEQLVERVVWTPEGTGESFVVTLEELFKPL